MLLCVGLFEVLSDTGNSLAFVQLLLIYVIALTKIFISVNPLLLALRLLLVSVLMDREYFQIHHGIISF